LEAYDVLVAGIFGLIFGSAINAVVWRLYVGRSWVRGRSECPDCGHTLAAKDLLPVVSWLALRGKCRYCRKPIKDHPAIELVTGVLFALSFYALHPANNQEVVKLGFWFGILVLMIVLAVYDTRWMLLPDKVMLPLIGLALIYEVTISSMARSPHALLNALSAAILAGGVFYAIVFFSRGRAMGGGDIKLAFAMGLILGPRNTLVAMMVAFNVAAIIGIGMIVSRRKGRKDQISFGPFLVFGTVIAFLFGHQIIEWYLRLNGLN
jgi:prepilin signal peptidase PulO-like enzyme (type II secretory pathway)